MGQKVNPHGLRVGVIKDWDSVWYANKDNYADFLVEDNAIRTYVRKKLENSSVSKIGIERINSNESNGNLKGKVKVTIFTSKPGIVIGRKGEEIQKLSNELQKLTSQKVLINIEEYDFHYSHLYTI